MRVQQQHSGLIISAAALFIFSATPVFSAASGHDWYCPDPEAHVQFEQHRKKHHDLNVEEIVATLEKIYQDEKLQPETRKVRAAEVIKDYSVKIKLGEGD